MKNHLSIFLAKEGLSDSEIIENVTDYGKDSFFLKTEFENKRIYYQRSYQKEPKWVNDFFKGFNQLDRTAFCNSNSSLVLLIDREYSEGKRTFILTMGFGKNMLADDVAEDLFGMKVILNTIDPDKIKRIQSNNVSGNSKITNEQMPRSSEISDFGFDINQDVLTSITGKGTQEGYFNCTMTGSQILSFSAEADFENIDSLLDQCYEQFVSSKYKERFGWIDNIRLVKDAKLKDKLNHRLIQMIQENSQEIDVCPPELIDWEDLSCFKIGRNKYEDLLFSQICKELDLSNLDIDYLNSKRVNMVSASSEMIYRSWPLYKCLVCELYDENETFVLNHGKWYRVERNYVEEINKYYEKAPIADFKLPDYSKSKDGRESTYNSRVASEDSSIICMDQKNIVVSGRSTVEVCDLLRKNNVLIHVKQSTGSAVLSHLFNQGYTSARLIKADSTFLEKANNKILEVTSDDSFCIGKKDMTIIYGIISKYKGERPHIPFFSKVSFRTAEMNLKAMDCNVYLMNIETVE